MVQKNKKELDIHSYETSYKGIVARLERSEISINNKNLIKNFDDLCCLEKLSIPRRMKIIHTLTLFAENYLKKEYDKASVENYKEAILKIEKNSEYSVWTKQAYSLIVRKFVSWLKYGDRYKLVVEKQRYPPEVDYIRAHIKPKDKPKVMASELLTEEDLDKILSRCDNIRDKAFISLLYELGGRISEIGNLKISHCKRDEYSYVIDLEGKTGHRTPRAISSDPFLTAWINSHPLRDDLNSPLWVSYNSNEHLHYNSLRSIVLRLVEKAGIKKRVYQHLFRHSRVTHLLMNKQVNEAQAKVYFGWLPASKMLSEYSHLVSEDVNDILLQVNGVKKN